MALRTGPASRPYYFAEHVHVCAARDYAVLLDTRRNKFLGLSWPQMHALAARVDNSVCATYPPESGAVAESIDPLIERMLEDGMLSTIAHTLVPTVAPQPSQSLYPGFTPFAVTIELHHLANAVAAWCCARLALGRGTVGACAKQANLRAQRRHTPGDIPLDRVRHLVAAFGHCRAWLYTTSGNCLSDSLAIHDFLSRYGIASLLVVGVRTQPFAAHAWVQIADCVINDRTDIVRAYEPIFTSG